MRKLSLYELGRPSLESYHKQEKVPIVVVLDDIRSAMNVGSFFRTCDAFKIQQIILCGITAQPPHKEILKTAIGATMSVPWTYEPEVLDVVLRLKTESYTVIGIEQTDESSSLFEFEVQKDQCYALIFGNEVKGISSSLLDLLDRAVEIPQYGTKHSLNVAVCGGIVISWIARHFV